MKALFVELAEVWERSTIRSNGRNETSNRIHRAKDRRLAILPTNHSTLRFIFFYAVEVLASAKNTKVSPFLPVTAEAFKPHKKSQFASQKTWKACRVRHSNSERTFWFPFSPPLAASFDNKWSVLRMTLKALPPRRARKNLIAFTHTHAKARWFLFFLLQPRWMIPKGKVFPI